MTIQEFQQARAYLDNRPLIDSQDDLENYLEAVITVDGHALCMDVRTERRKMARLIVRALLQV